MWDSSRINSIAALESLLSLAGGEKPDVRHINRFAEVSVLANGLKEAGFANFLKYLAGEALIKQQKKQQKKLAKKQKKYLVVYSTHIDYGSYCQACRICSKAEDETFKEMLEREGVYSAELIIEGENIKILDNWSEK